MAVVYQKYRAKGGLLGLAVVVETTDLDADEKKREELLCRTRCAAPARRNDWTSTMLLDTMTGTKQSKSYDWTIMKHCFCDILPIIAVSPKIDNMDVTVSYLSGAYVAGFVVLLVGVVLPMLYMVLQNKKAFKAVRRD